MQTNNVLYTGRCFCLRRESAREGTIPALQSVCGMEII